MLWLGERCLADVVPLLSAPDVNYIRIVQTPTHVVIYKEFDHIARVIPISDAPFLPPDVRFWNGDSRGRWVDDTFVIEARNFRPENAVEGSGPGLVLTERLSLVGPDQIRYEFTVEDRESFAASWTALTYIHRTDKRMFEFACHEGNTSMTAILRGARLLERLAAEASE